MNKRPLSEILNRSAPLRRQVLFWGAGRLVPAAQQWMENYGRPICTVMLLGTAGAAIWLSCACLTKKPPVSLQQPAMKIFIPSGISKLLTTGRTLTELWQLQSQVDGLLKKDSLCPADRLLLHQAACRLQLIHHQNQHDP